MEEVEGWRRWREVEGPSQREEAEEGEMVGRRHEETLTE